MQRARGLRGPRSSLDDEGVARLALEYTTRSREFVRSVVSGPAADLGPAEIVLRFHSRIYFTTTRALVGRALIMSGVENRGGDATACARETMAAVARSRHALAQFPDAEERRELLRLLDAIARAIETRFASG